MLKASDIDFTGGSFSKCSIPHSEFTRVNFTRVNFTGTNLIHCKFIDVNEFVGAFVSKATRISDNAPGWLSELCAVAGRPGGTGFEVWSQDSKAISCNSKGEARTYPNIDKRDIRFISISIDEDPGKNVR